MATQAAPTTKRPVWRVSIEDKKNAWMDGFAAAILEEPNMSHMAVDMWAYSSGYDAGEAWRERKGM